MLTQIIIFIDLKCFEHSFIISIKRWELRRFNKSPISVWFILIGFINQNYDWMGYVSLRLETIENLFAVFIWKTDSWIS